MVEKSFKMIQRHLIDAQWTKHKSHWFSPTASITVYNLVMSSSSNFPSRAGALQFSSRNRAEFFYALVRIFQFCTLYHNYK